MDVGEALTRDQMNEYREVCEARRQGKSMRRLDVTAFVMTLLLVGAIALWLAWSIQQ